MRTLLVALFALALLGTAPSAQAQTICWDIGCAAGTAAADCWRAWCADGWSYPAYPYRAPGWYRTDWPARDPAPPTRVRMTPLTRAAGCSTGDPLDWVAWGC